MSTTPVVAASSAATIAATNEHSAGLNHEDPQMQAATQHRYGNADKTTVEHVARPTIADDEVLIEVVSAGLDRGVVHLMTGTPYLIRLMGYGLLRPKNPILGSDVAGRVVATGASVTRFAVGDEVMGIAKGSFAEYAAAGETKLVHKPPNVTYDDAAASTISGMTALQALTTEGHVSAGERVLIIGASGGVGTFAVQIAVALGAVVTGVASGAKGDLVRSLGATKVIDYTTTDLAELDEQFDLIIDVGGRNGIRKLRKILTPTGRLVIVGGEDGGRFTGGIGRQLRAAMLSPFVNQTLGFFISEEDSQYIEPLAELVANGDVVPAVSARFTLESAPAAIRSMDAGGVSGKVVIKVSGS